MQGHGDRAMKGEGKGGREYRCVRRQLCAFGLGILCARLVGHDSLGTTKLALDLFAGPAGCLDGTWLELSVGLGFLDHSSDPILTESINQFTVGVSIRKVAVYVSLVSVKIMVHEDLPNNAHGSSHQRFTSVHVIGNEVEDVEDDRHILLEGLG